MSTLLASLEKTLAYEQKIKAQADLIARQCNELALSSARIRILELRLQRKFENASLLREHA